MSHRHATASNFPTNRIRSLLSRSGRARRDAATAPQQLCEQLEGRVMLAGDHPSFNQVFNTPSPLGVLQIQLDPTTGEGTATGNISPAGDNDVFRFTAPANDFVTVWADALTNGSTLDSRVEIWTRGAEPNFPPLTPTPLFSGSNNGTLTSGVFKDGWVGFVATAGTEYFIVVKSDVLSGLGSVGNYTVRVDGLTSAFPALNPVTGAGQAAGSITLRGSDRVYKVVTGTQNSFISDMTIAIRANPADFDPRLDVYDSTGTLIIADDDTGAFTDSFAVIASAPNRTFYIRVRSDKIGDPAIQPSTGAYTLAVDGIATRITMDPVTRQGSAGGSLPNIQAHQFYQFQAQGTGLTLITLRPRPLPPIQDSALRIYNSQGVLIGFNELQSNFSLLQIQLVGGTTYYVVVENFNGTDGGVYRLDIESHHTWDPNQPIDDHQNTPNYDPQQPPAFGGTDWFNLYRQFNQATPIIWNPTQDAPTPPFPGLPDIAADHSKVWIGHARGRIYAGGDTDLFQFIPPTDMLGEYTGHVQGEVQPGQPAPDPAQWEAFHRPATRVQIFVNGNDLLNARVRVYDSNFALIYGQNDIVITPGFPDPAGALDPASFPPELPLPDYGFTFAQGQPANLQVWGGEVYYLEVAGTGADTYNVEIQVDAPDDTVVSVVGPTPASPGQWTTAYELRVDPETGEARNYANNAGGAIVVANPFIPSYTLTTGTGYPHFNGRSYAFNTLTPAGPPPNNPPGSGAAVISPLQVTPGTRGTALLQSGDFGNLVSPTDADLYQFRALYTGYAEIWVNTTQITDEFLEGKVDTEDNDPMTPPATSITARKTKTYNSPLDSALRVFNNDFQQIVYNNDNGVTSGEAQVRTVGSHGNRLFWRRDARVVIPVESGKSYFIQVESGQRNNFSLAFPKVDWRHASGTYELLVNSMPNLNFNDDHINFAAAAAVAAQASPIPMNLNNPSTSAVLGQADGRIVNNLANPQDSDLFTVISPGNGTATITVSVQPPDEFSPPDSFTRRVRVFNPQFQLIGQRIAVNQDDASVNIQARTGDRFYIVVDSNGTGQDGSYRVKVSGIPRIDDYSSVPDIFNSHVIDKDLYDYDRTESLLGSLEAPGDTDVFSFETIAFDVATVTVTPLSPTLTPRVDIYEVSEDPDGHPVLLRIATNATGRISFSVTAPPRTSGATGNTYNSYFIVVSGANPFLHYGDYRLTLDFNVATDDHPDIGQWNLATPVPLDQLGNGLVTGVIERSGDTDLFTFVADASGRASATILSPSGSLLLPRLRVFDEDNNPVEDIFSGNEFVTGPDQTVSTATFTFTVARGRRYFVAAEGVLLPGAVFKIRDTGSYAVTINAPVPDDHPNEGEFEIADVITLSSFTGRGSANGQLEYDLDTDLFTFTTLVDGDVVVSLLVPQNTFRAFVRLFDGNRNEIGFAVNDGGPGDEDGVRNGRVIRTIHGTSAADRYYVLISSDQTEPPGSLTGNYILTIIGNAPPPGDDDYPNAGQWDEAAQIDLSPLTGAGSITGVINSASDSDLFYFHSLAGSPQRPLRAYVQVLTPAGSPLDVGVIIWKELPGGAHVQVGSDTVGVPGSNAWAQFFIDQAPGKYFVEVDNINGQTGGYTVKVETTPAIYTLFYPEGFSNPNIREYVSIGNANPFDVSYTIRLHFEDTSLPELIIADGAVLGANTRGGITISDGPNGRLPGVPVNKAYAIIIESDGFLAANISHYDFNSTLGEAFTRTPSTSWTFARGSKLPGEVNDFLVYYNPNDTESLVTLTIYKSDGSTVAMSQIVEPRRRFGWNFQATLQIPVGDFSFVVTSEAAHEGDEHIGIVAALSHYDRVNLTGYGVLGDPDGGSITGIVPEMIQGNGANASVVLFNPNNADASVGLVGQYINSGLAPVLRHVVIPPRSSVTLTGVDFSLVNGDLMGLRYDSNLPISVIGGSRRHGATDTTQANTVAATRWFWGDAFINRNAAGTFYFEDMYFYNPDILTRTITLDFVFNTGERSSYSFIIGGKSFSTVALHNLPAILNHRVFNWFSIEASSNSPFVAKLTHYDLVLNGGWGTKGAPLGPTTPLGII